MPSSLRLLAMNIPQTVPPKMGNRFEGRLIKTHEDLAMAELNNDTTGDAKLLLFKPKQLPQTKRLSGKGFKAQATISKYSLIAGGVGMAPLGRFTGQVAVAGLLLKLLRDLYAIYHISFSEQQGKILIASILGGAHYGWISRYLMRFIGSYTPVLHGPGALLLRPAVSGLMVYYIGRLFLLHLESGVWHAATNQQIGR